MNSSLQPIDFNHLNSIVNGDEDFKRELIKIFLEQIPEFVINLNSFFESKNLEKLAREAHTAKSSVLIFGMTNTGKLLKNIQLWAENNESEKIGTALKQVITDLDDAKAELQNLIK